MGIILRFLLLGAQLEVVFGDYFPLSGTIAQNPRSTSEAGTGTVARHSTFWEPPHMMPWDPVRATNSSITVAWTIGWNPWSEVSYYELQARRPKGYPLVLADRLRLQFREADTEVTWPQSEKTLHTDDTWSSWKVVYDGRGRVYTLPVPVGSPHAAQFRVRACGRAATDGCSNFSSIQTAHTVLSATQDKINFHIRGTGKNAHNYSSIEINQITLYKRRDETGLVLAVFSRLDMSLQWLQTYDTHRNRTQSLLMSKHIRQFNQSFFVVVVSTIAWEWNAPQSLVKTLEFCGAYHFGQWAHVFAEQKHYKSTKSDLQQTASQEEFGHPYALVGIPGIGTGNGWESLMHNTGHYLPANLRPQDAVIRGIFYYDYVYRLYRVQDIYFTKAAFYEKSAPPVSETFHNPIPSDKIVESTGPSLDTMLPSYTPYVGTLSNFIANILEANETVPPYNYAFLLRTSAGVQYVDPRPAKYWLTEIERVWQGASARYWATNGTLFFDGMELSERSCAGFVYHDFRESSPEKCGDNSVNCCDAIDADDVLVFQCGLGVAPTLCRDNEVITQTIVRDYLYSKWPYNFRVINWNS